MIIPVIEEEAFLEKRVVETGKVRISKQVSEHEELIDVSLFREDVTVERVPRDKYVDAAPAVRYEGDVMIFSVVEEQLVIQKRIKLVEELRVSKQVVETTLTNGPANIRESLHFRAKRPKAIKRFQ